MKKVLIAISFVTLFISCGPNAQEKADIQKKHDDSLKNATENDIMQKLKAREDSILTAKNNENAIKNAQKQHDDSIANSVAAKYQQKETIQNNQEVLNRMQNQFNALQRMLVEDDAKLSALKDHKKSDEGFHLGRTQSQREQWLRNDQRDIDNMVLQMQNIKKQMEDLKTKAKQYK